MTLPLAAREAADRLRRRSFEPVMTFAGGGLVLGDTILAPLQRGQDATRKIAMEGFEDRILALLVAAYGKTLRPGILGNIRRAAQYWWQGENDLAAIEIALSGLPPLPDIEQASARLAIGEQLLAAGVSPRELIELCGLDPASLDFLKAGYNPDQPRIPTGNPDGGQWTAEATLRPLLSARAPARQHPPKVSRRVHRADCPARARRFMAMRRYTQRSLRDIRLPPARPTTRTK